jgi:Carboxypeptidase regulatory-like domain
MMQKPSGKRRVFSDRGAFVLHYPKHTFAPPVIALLLSGALFGQAASRLGSTHIHGKVEYSHEGTPAPGTELTFQNAGITQTVTTNQDGQYQVDLPPALYTMTAKGGSFGEYDRPLFRAAPGKDLNLNVQMPADLTCDYVLPAPGHAPLRHSNDVDACGGARDTFPAPEGNTPFEIAIRYQSRRKTDLGFVYYVAKTAPSYDPQVEVAYNVFTLHANRVVFDVRDHTVSASVYVISEWADGATKRAESLRVKLANGQATVIP